MFAECSLMIILIINLLDDVYVYWMFFNDNKADVDTPLNKRFIYV